MGFVLGQPVIVALSKTYSPVVVNFGTGGSSTAHAHNIDLRVKYVDALVASLD